MRYEEAKQYLKEGMTICYVKVGPCCAFENGDVGKIIFVDNRWKIENEFHLLQTKSEGYFQEDEIEILTNPDGTPWVHPDKQKFKVGDRVMIVKDGPENHSGKGVGYEFEIREISNNYCREKVGVSRGVRTSLLEKIEEPKTAREVMMMSTPSGIPTFFEEFRKLSERKFEKYYLGVDFGYESKPKRKSFMSNIVEKIKNLKLSETDRILRKHGLEDENGRMTSEAMDLMDEELQQDRWKTRREEIAKDILAVESEDKK